MLTYSKYSKALAVLLASAILTVGACATKSESDDAACQAGAELCPCLSNGICDDGLTCATNLNKCVRLAGSTGGTTGTGGAASGAGGGTGGNTPGTGGSSTGGAGGKGTGGGTGGSGTGGNGTGGAGGKGTGGSGTGGAGGKGTGGSGTGGTGTGGTGTGGNATGGTPGTGGVTSTTCSLTNHSGNGSFTYYYFGQGTAKDGSGYRTACGYYGTESGQVDTIQNISNTSPAKNTYFAAIPGQNGFDSKSHCGECVQITGQNGKSVIATIIDECPYGGDGNNSACANNPSGHLDLSVDVFNQLGYSVETRPGPTGSSSPAPSPATSLRGSSPATRTSSSSKTRSWRSPASPGRAASPTAPGTSEAISAPGSRSSSPTKQIASSPSSCRAPARARTKTPASSSRPACESRPDAERGAAATPCYRTTLMLSIPVLVAPHSRIHIAMYISGPRADERLPRSSTSVHPNDFRSATTFCFASASSPLTNTVWSPPPTALGSTITGAPIVLSDFTTLRLGKAA